MGLQNNKALEKYQFDLDEFRSNLRGVGYNIYLMKSSDSYQTEEQFEKLENDYKKSLQIYSDLKKNNKQGYDFIGFYGEKLEELENELNIFKERVLSGEEFSSSKIEKILYSDLKKVF